MITSIRSHLVLGTAALVGATTIAMTPVDRPNFTSVAFQPTPPIVQTLDVALAALQRPAAAATGDGYTCSPEPFCHIFIGFGNAYTGFFQNVLTPILEFLAPGITTSYAGLIWPVVLLAAPILAPIRIIQKLLNPVKPAASRGVGPAAAVAAPLAAVKAVSAARPASKSPITSKRARAAASAPSAAAVAAPDAAPKTGATPGARRSARAAATDLTATPRAAASRHR